MAAQVAVGGAAGLRAAGAKGAGMEFSHWIPKRWLPKRFAGSSIWNGNYVSPARHYYHDYARFPVKNSKQVLGDKWPFPVQQLDRIPNVYKGAALGAGKGLAGLSSRCECK